MDKELKTRRGWGLGAHEDDAANLRRFMEEYGWTQTRLAKEASLSQKQISRVLNGEQKLSAASSDRVFDAFRREHKRRAAEAQQQNLSDSGEEGIELEEEQFEEEQFGSKKYIRLSPEAAARIRERANERLEKGRPHTPEIENLLDYCAFVDLREAIESRLGPLTAHKALVSLGGPPRDPDAYQAWKAKQIELHAAAQELPVAKAWIKEMERRRDELQKQVSMLEEIRANHKEVIDLYAGLVKRLKKQLTDAGIEPTE